MTGILDGLAGPVLVVGAYGYRNLGDEAILAGLLAKLGDRVVTVVSRDPAATRRMHRVPAIGIPAAGPALLRHRSVVIGGGGLFGRDMGSIGRLLPLFGLAAEALGRYVVVDGVDVDGDLSRTARALVPRLLRRANDVTVRDRRSVVILEGWNVHAHLGPDLSAWMPMAPIEAGRRLLRAAGVDTHLPVVGLALAGVRPDLADAALDAVAASMDALPDTQFCFIPMSRHPRVPTHDDLRLARRLQAGRPRLAILEGSHHPADVLSAFEQLSAVISMRYHGMLFAERVGVPLVPLVYAEKNVRWLDEHGLLAVPAEAVPMITALRSALAGGERAGSRPIERVAS
jgi:polysaccharide pyruvyl transferase WcaK-like protein